MEHLKTGPTGTHPLGKLMFKGDKGGLVVAFAASKKLHLAVFDFGATITRISSPAAEAIATALGIQKVLKDTFGELECDPSTFPFLVTGDNKTGLVETDLVIPMYTMVANPEVFWVWSEKMIAAAGKITSH